MPPDPLEGQKHSPCRFAACKTFLGQALLSRHENLATTLTTVKTRKDDLTSDPAWVIALFGHNIFMYFHVKNKNTKVQVLIACVQAKDITFTCFISSYCESDLRLTF